MADSHPIVAHPRLHCGVCGNPMLFPRKIAMNKMSVMEDNKAVDKVLAECNVCCVAVHIPVSTLQPLPPVPCDKTVARPWK